MRRKRFKEICLRAAFRKVLKIFLVDFSDYILISKILHKPPHTLIIFNAPKKLMYNRLNKHRKRV